MVGYYGECWGMVLVEYDEAVTGNGGVWYGVLESTVAYVAGHGAWWGGGMMEDMMGMGNNRMNACSGNGIIPKKRRYLANRLVSSVSCELTRQD